MYKSVYNLSCSCNLMRNGHFVPFSNQNKGKGKRIHLYAFFDQNSEEMSSTKHPFLQLEPSNTNESLYKCGLYQIQKIHQTFINEGKITIDVAEGEASVNILATDISLREHLVQKQIAHLCVTESTQQSLKLFITKLGALIQTYAAKSKNQSSGSGKKLSTIQQNKPAAEAAAAKGHFQFKVEKRVSINQMKINLQPPQKQVSNEKQKELVVKDVIEVDKQSIGQNITKQFNKIDHQNILQQQSNKVKSKEQQQQQQQKVLNKEKEREKSKPREKSIERKPLVEDIIVELQMDDEEEDPSNQTQKVNHESRGGLKENRIYSIFEEGYQQKGNENLSQEKTIEHLQQLQVNSDSTSFESKMLNSPSVVSNKLGVSDKNQNKINNNLLSPLPNGTYPAINQSPSTLNNKILSPSLNQLAQEIIEDLEDKEIRSAQKQQQSLRDSQNRQMLLEKDNFLTEQKKQLSQKQLELCERQLLLNQQEKLLRKQQLISDQQLLEDSLNMEKISLIKQKELLEKEIKEYDSNTRNAPINNAQMQQKYFLEKKNIELQYEREQKLLQSETESSMLANNNKFIGLQNKLQEIKNKQQQKKLEIMQQQSNKKNLYKVDRSIATKPALSNGQTLALKRRNPFSMDDDNEDENFNNPEHYYVQTSAIHPNSQDNNKAMQVYEANQMIDEQISLQTKANNIGNSSANNFQTNQLFQIKEGLNPIDLPPSIQSVKKLGKRYVFEKNSFNVKVLDDNSQDVEEEEQNLPQRYKINQSSKRVSTRQIQSQDEQKNNTLPLSFNIKEYLMKLPDHVIANMLDFIPKKQLFQLRTVSKFFNDSFFLTIKNLVLTQRDTPNEKAIHMLEKAKHIQNIYIGQLVNLKPDKFAEAVEKRQIKTLTKLDLSNYTSLTIRLFVAFMKGSNSLTDISIPFFSRVTEEQLLQVDIYLRNLQRLALKSRLDNFNNNDKISDQILAKVITDLYKLHTFEVFTTSPTILDRIENYQNLKKEKYDSNVQKNTELNTMHLLKPYDNVYDRLECLKIRNLVMTRFADDDLNNREKSLQKLELFKNLKSLKIVNIVKKSKGEWFLPYTPQTHILNNIFKSCQKIQHLSLGKWCTNEVLETISQQINSLVKIRLIGNQVDDTGLEFIFQKMDLLQKINIVEATRINGHCFESMISRSVKEVKVKFDDFRLNCLHSTISHILQLNGVKITNYNT